MDIIQFSEPSGKDQGGTFQCRIQEVGSDVGTLQALGLDRLWPPHQRAPFVRRDGEGIRSLSLLDRRRAAAGVAAQGVVDHPPSFDLLKDSPKVCQRLVCSIFLLCSNWGQNQMATWFTNFSIISDPLLDGRVFKKMWSFQIPLLKDASLFIRREP